MTKIFLTIDGQNENIGDSILRRGLLKSFQGLPGTELHVLIGPRVDGMPQPHKGPGNDARYLTAVGLDGTEITYESSSSWYRTALRSLLRGRVILVQHAGERYFPKPRPWTGWRSLLSAIAVRVRGGAALQLGGSATIKLTRAPWAERAACRFYRLVEWRDAPSHDVFGTGGIMPDFAFSEGSDPDADGLGDAPKQRSILAVSVRGDRPPLSAEKVEWLRSIAADRGLELQVFTQVRRDGPYAVELAKVLHPERPAIAFGEETHAEWEQTMRALFRRTAIVASDRAHGVIIAATEGAIPLPISSDVPIKAARLLAPAGFDAPIGSGAEVDRYLTRMLDDDRSVVDRIIGARADIERVRREIRALVGR